MITEQQIKQACLDSIRHWEDDILAELLKANKIYCLGFNKFTLLYGDGKISEWIVYDSKTCPLCKISENNKFFGDSDYKCMMTSDNNMYRFCPLANPNKNCQNTPWYDFDDRIINYDLGGAFRECRNMIDHMKSRFNELGYL